MLNFIFKSFAVIFLCVNFCITATSMEEMKQKYVNLILECSKQFPVTPSDIEQLKNKQMPDNESAKCLFSCAYKKAGMMDDQGKMSVEGVHKITQKYLSDDPEKLKRAEEFTEACKSVNDVPVSDGEKGCERAALIFKCSVEKASQFNFAI